MLLATQGWELLPSQYLQTSCCPLLPPVLPFTLWMFLNWQSRQATLKTSSQNMYWGKRMVESLFFIYLFYNSTRWAETDRTEGWWFSGLLLLSTDKHGKHLIVLSTLWNPWFHCRKIPVFPWDFLPQHWKPGLAAWTEHQTQGQAGVPEWTGALILPEHFSWNISAFAVSSITGDNITSLSLN